jgi:hypothetical protein
MLLSYQMFYRNFIFKILLDSIVIVFRASVGKENDGWDGITIIFNNAVISVFKIDESYFRGYAEGCFVGDYKSGKVIDYKINVCCKTVQ